MADHLWLPPGRPLTSRRRRGTPLPPRAVRRASHGAQLREQLEDVELPRVVEAPGIEEMDTRVVLKIDGATRLDSGPLRGLKLTALGEGRGWTYAVLSDQESRDMLIGVLEEYEDEQADWNHPATWARLLDNIDGISVYGRADRYDRELDSLTFERLELLDVGVWPSGTATSAEERATVVVELVRKATRRNASIRVVAIDPRPQTTVIRVHADRQLLSELLDEPWVERVRPPLRPQVTHADILGASVPVPIPEAQGAPIGVVDGVPVTANPLLSGAIIGLREFPDGHVFAGPDAHGTRVSAAAVWGSLDFLVRQGLPTPSPHPVASARVLEFDGSSDSVVGQPHVTITAAIKWLVSEHRVRVVNLSINRREPISGLLPSELTATLDNLARELDVVIVVSSGNRLQAPAKGWLPGYPEYLIDDKSGIAEPGDAAIAVTVGSFAKRDVPDGNSQSLIAIARSGQPSPFTRSGPTRGTTSAGTLKPEFVDHGGNWAHDHQIDSLRAQDPGISIVAAIPPTGDRFLGVDNGTSYAAPTVAREVARIATRYPDASANLLRALLALSGRPPASEALNGVDPLRISAYGQPDADRILESGGPVAILTIEAEITTDSVVIHEVPIPYEFAHGVSRRLFRVALAFDPPVRRSRREYIAGTMAVELVRGLTEDEVAARYQLQPTMREAAEDQNIHRLDLPTGRNRPPLEPGVKRLASNTLIRRDFDYRSWDPDDEHYYLVVSHNLSPWTAAQKRGYPTQKYALAVFLADEGRADLDLHNLVRAQLRTRARLRGLTRARSRT